MDGEANYTLELGPVTKFSGNPLFGEFGSKGGKPWELAWLALAWPMFSKLTYDHDSPHDHNC